MGDSKGGRRPLTYDDGLAIERGLNRGDRIAWIARTIGRAPKVVAEEVKRNWTDEKIGRELGMEPDEVLRLCQMSGLAELFADEEFSKAWDIADSLDFEAGLAELEFEDAAREPGDETEGE